MDILNFLGAIGSVKCLSEFIKFSLGPTSYILSASGKLGDQVLIRKKEQTYSVWYEQNTGLSVWRVSKKLKTLTANNALKK